MSRRGALQWDVAREGCGEGHALWAPEDFQAG